MHFFMISRATAKAVGFPYFCVGKVCPFGNVWQRQVSNYLCLCQQCSTDRAIKAASVHDANPSARKASYRRWAEKNPGAAAKRERAKRASDIERNRQIQTQWQRKNREKVIAARRQQYLKDPEKSKERSRAYQLRKLKRIPAWYGEYDRFVVGEMYRLAEERLKATGFVWEIDHMLPLQAETLSGLHCATNLQLIPQFLNSAKKNRLQFTEPEDWLCALR